MPTNLPPEYFEVERRYKTAQTNEEKITLLEELISTIPKHKGTDKLRADLRRRLSRMKDTALAQKKKTGRHESGFHIEREGAGKVVLVGPPNVGKSSLVTALTHATPKVSEAPFTTWTPTPGMMQFENIQIQLIDTPPLSREHIEPEMMDMIRTSELILSVIDLQAFPFEQLEEALCILGEHYIEPLHKKMGDEQRRITYLPFIIVVNKGDNEKSDEDFQAFCELMEEGWTLVLVSAITQRNFDQLKHAIFKALEIIRVYSKPPGKEADLTSPFVLKKGCTMEEFAAKVHHDFVKNLKSARVWGSVPHDGQQVGRDHVLQDGDIVELHL
jgi:ribosome-interacting GTPase 1